MKNIKTEYEERSKQGASEAGYHFYNTYLTCPRKFYLSYVKGLKPKKISKALTYGKTFHDMVELRYLGWSPEDVVEYGLYALEQSYPLYNNEGDYREDLSYISPMFLAWNKYSFNNEEPLIEVEKPHVLTLPGGYRLTGRIDRVLEIDGKIAIVDTKTSKGQWASLTKPLKAATQGDQFTLYRLMVMQDYDIDYIPDVYIDVIICKTYTKTGIEAQATRHLLPSVTMEELNQVRDMYTGLVCEVSAKVMELSNNISGDLLFPRSSILCSTYGCEMENVCRGYLTNGEINGNFTIEPPPLDIQTEANENMKVTTKGDKE